MGVPPGSGAGGPGAGHPSGLAPPISSARGLLRGKQSVERDIYIYIYIHIYIHIYIYIYIYIYISTLTPDDNSLLRKAARQT